MISVSTRIWAGILAVCLLPLAAVASDGDATAPSNKTAASATTAPAAPNPAPAVALSPTTDPLLRLLATKGILSVSEVNALAAAPGNEMQGRLLLLLKDKGLLSADDLNALAARPAASAAVAAETVVATPAPAEVPAQGSTAPKPPAPIGAVTPLRVLQFDPPKREGFIPDIKIGEKIRVKPYGFFKTTAVYDTESPYGNDRSEERRVGKECRYRW